MPQTSEETVYITYIKGLKTNTGNLVRCLVKFLLY